MNGLIPTAQGGGVGTNPGPSWHVVGSGDYDIDQRSDILWQNDDGTCSRLDDERPDGGAGSERGRLLSIPGSDWHIIG